MKPVSQWLHRTSVLATFVLVTACGSSPQQDVTPTPDAVPSGNYYVGENDVYAHLESGSGGSWIFTEITESEVQPANGYLVRLNDLAPAFDTRIAECAPQAYPTNHKCNPMHPFRSKDVGVIGKIISGGIAAGTAGKVTDLSRTYKTSFDETVFNQAVDEALKNSSLDSERQEFLAALEDYAAIVANGRAELNELERETEAKYRDTGAVQLDIQPELTGLVAYYTNDLDFGNLVELLPRSTGHNGGKPLEEKRLLPCDARLCVQNARNAIVSARADVENAKMSLVKEVSAGSDVYDVRCDKTTQAGYLFTLTCPAEVARVSTEPTQIQISLHIIARDFDDLYPSIDIADDNLSVAVDENSVTFTNLTPGYLSVMAQTVYYNSQVQTSAAEISVAPGAAVKRPIGEFVSPAIDIESSYRQMTPDKAGNASFRFGFAAKYRIAGAASDTTLYDLRTFNVGCAIGNRMNPGSCTEAADEDARVQEVEKLQPQVPH